MVSAAKTGTEATGPSGIDRLVYILVAIRVCDCATQVCVGCE
jgi:hypothetical protein